VPLHVDLRPPLTPERLRVVLTSACYASVNLHNSLAAVRPVPPESPALVVSALASSASTLTALRGLPLVEPADHPEPGLAAFTQLRALELRQTSAALQVLRVTQLPASLTDLELSAVTFPRTGLPLFVGLDGLSSLRQITSAGHVSWKLGSWDDDAGERCQLRLPPVFEVCSAGPAPICCAGLRPIVLQDPKLQESVGAAHNQSQDAQRLLIVSFLVEAVVGFVILRFKYRRCFGSSVTQRCAWTWFTPRVGVAGAMTRTDLTMRRQDCLGPSARVYSPVQPIGSDSTWHMLHVTPQVLVIRSLLVWNVAPLIVVMKVVALIGLLRQAAAHHVQHEADRPTIVSRSPLLFMFADGGLTAARGPGTSLPPGIAGIRAQTNRFECRVDEWLPAEGRRGYPEDAVQLLCRTLQLTPAWYRQFQLTHHRPDKPLELTGRVWLAVANRQTLVEYPAMEFDGVVELAAAMQRFAHTETLSLYVGSSSYRSIFIQKTGGDLPVWCCHCEAHGGRPCIRCAGLPHVRELLKRETPA